MKVMKKRNPIFLILLLLLAIVLTAGLVYVNYMTRVIYGLPGKSVSSVSALKHGLLLYQGREKMLAIPTGNGLPEVKVSVEPDQSARQLCTNLEQLSLVQSADLTCAYLVYSGQDRSIQPGNYTIPMGLNAIEIADLISDATRRDKQFAIYAGWRIEEIAAVIDGLGLSFSAADFLTLATAPPEPYREQLEIPQGMTLEGYLFPGNYSVKPDISLENFVAEILTRFKTSVLTEEFEKDLQNSGLTLHQALTMASIIQRETIAEEEMATIASVFYNRLAIGMRLETDPTVQYALGYDAQKNTWWKSPLTFTDLEANSPYNTYRNPGLPPGPISNPSLNAIKAAVAPAETDYLFFRAKCDGSLTHNFSKTYEEHLNFGCD
jgi:UPF0755 protein